MSDTNESADDAKPPAEQTDEEILDEARDRYRICQDADSDNRGDALDDLRFLAGGENQWDPIAVAQRRAARRPMITVNTLPTYLHQVTNDQRQNSPSIKVHPVGEGADQESAKVRQGMIRHIEYESNADVAYDTAVNSAAAIGFGYFRIMPEYESETSFNQKLCFKRVANALSVKIDPLNQEPDGSGMQYCFIECLMDRAEFKRDHPDAKASDPTIFQGSTSYVGWLTDSTVLVCEYFRIDKTDAEVVLLSNGESGFKDDLLELPPGVTIENARAGTRSKVMWYKITGVDILERTEIKCKWIPVFPVYGDELNIEGKIIRSGIIRHAKGPAQLYNVMMTTALEEVSVRSKSPYVMAEGQEEGHEDEWSVVNNTPLPYVTYKPTSVDGHLVPPPQRSPMADIPTGYLALAMHSSDNVKKTTGLFDASLGAKGTARSGVQEKAQIHEGDVANYHYMDGLLRTIRHAGRCIDCMFPKYYDWQGVAKIMREDGKMASAQINTPQSGTDAQGNQIQTILNDMTCGDFDVTVGAGPSYSTMRQESAEFFATAMQSAKDPGTAAVVTYLAMKNQDVPGAEEATEMLKTLLPPQAAAALDQGKDAPMVNTPHGPLAVPEAEQAIAQMSQQLEQMSEALKKADASKQQIEAMKQQQILNEQQLEPGRQQAEQMKIAADMEKAKAATIAAQADLLRAQAEAAAIPAQAHADAQRAETEHMTAQVNLLTEHQKQQVEAANAEADALKGDGEALEMWKAALASETAIRVNEMTNASAERRAVIAARAATAKAEKSQSKGNGA